MISLCRTFFRLKGFAGNFKSTLDYSFIVSPDLEVKAQLLKNGDGSLSF